jgi:hypothetical protein
MNEAAAGGTSRLLGAILDSTEHPTQHCRACGKLARSCVRVIDRSSSVGFIRLSAAGRQSVGAGLRAGRR